MDVSHLSDREIERQMDFYDQQLHDVYRGSRRCMYLRTMKLLAREFDRRRRARLYGDWDPEGRGDDD